MVADSIASIVALSYQLNAIRKSRWEAKKLPVVTKVAAWETQKAARWRLGDAPAYTLCKALR